MTTMLWIATGLLAGGGLLVGIGVLLYRRTQRFLATAVPTEGTIVDFKVSEDSDGDSNYFPIFRFRDASGQEHQITSNTGTNPPGFKKGQSVGIFYDPQHPEDACLDTFWRLWIGPIILFTLGGLPAGVGLILLMFGLLGG